MKESQRDSMHHFAAKQTGVLASKIEIFFAEQSLFSFI